MKTFSLVLATTNIDSHFEALSLEALESLVEQVNSTYLPMFQEHNPLLPPLGRVVSAKLNKREEGYYEALAIGQQYEPGDEIPFDSSRCFTIHSHQTGKPVVSYDRGFLDEASKVKIEDIADALNAAVEFENKKSLVSLAILAITFVGVSTANGFFRELGRDIYTALKSWIAQLFTGPAEGSGRILCFRLILDVEGYEVEVEIFFRNASEDSLNSFIEFHLGNIENDVKSYDCVHRHLRRFAFEYSDSSLRLLYALRSDGIPLTGPMLEQIYSTHDDLPSGISVAFGEPEGL